MPGDKPPEELFSAPQKEMAKLIEEERQLNEILAKLEDRLTIKRQELSYVSENGVGEGRGARMKDLKAEILGIESNIKRHTIRSHEIHLLLKHFLEEDERYDEMLGVDKKPRAES